MSLQNPRVPQPHSSNFGAQFGRGLGLGDFNGDGHKDLAVASNGVVDVFAGSPNGITTTRTTEILTSDVATGMGAGDFNGDGYADLAIGFWTANNTAGEARIYRGSSSGLSTTPDLVIPALSSSGRFGHSLVAGEDYNLDGRDDLVVGAIFELHGNGNYGRVHVYLGSGTGLSATPSLSLSSGHAFGGAESNVGDYDGDGYPDLAVGESGDPSQPSFKVYIYRGGPGGLSASPFAVLQGPTSERWGFERPAVTPRPTGLGDLDGDGRSEIAIGQAHPGTNADPREPEVFVYRGGQAGFLSTPDVVMPPAPSGTPLYVGGFAGVGYEAEAD